MLQAIIQTHDVRHMGITKLYLQLRQQYYSLKLREMVKHVVQTCQIVKPLHPSNKKQIKMAKLPEPCSMCSMDIKDYLSAQDSSFSYILVIKELWSSYITLVLLQNTTAKDIAQAIYSEIILPFGNFKNLCTDNAANLTTLAIKEICHLLSTKTRKSYAYQAATNGKIEWTSVIRDALRKFGQYIKD